MPHGPRHPQRVLGRRDAGVQQHAVAAQFHGHTHVAGGADAGIDDDRVLRVAILQIFQDDPDVVGLSTPWPLPIGLPAGITLVAPARLRRRAMIGSSLV